MHGNVNVVAGLQAAEHFDDDGVAHHERGVRLLTTEALNEPNRLRGRSTAMQTLTWARRASEAFLTGYGWPNTAEQDVLAAYEADKASYEIVYETLNRPTWVDIPLSAIRAMGQD